MTSLSDPIDIAGRRRDRLRLVAAHVVAALAASAGRTRRALRNLADVGQLGPDPEAVRSRWAGSRI